MSLVLEKRFDAITVQQLLDRAEVGRTSFYQRYRNKDDFLLKSFERMLEAYDHVLTSEGPACLRVAPVRELFGHIRENHGFHRALGRSRKLDDMYQAGVDTMTGTIGARLPDTPPLLARAYAGALFALLRWWIDKGYDYTPQDMDDLFHGMVRGTLSFAGVVRTMSQPARDV